MCLACVSGVAAVPEDYPIHPVTAVTLLHSHWCLYILMHHPEVVDAVECLTAIDSNSRIKQHLLEAVLQQAKPMAVIESVRQNENFLWNTMMTCVTLLLLLWLLWPAGVQMFRARKMS